MLNSEIFENYGTEKWVIEENLSYMLQEYWEAASRELKKYGKDIPMHSPINTVGFVKGFMKEETLVSAKYAEKSKMETLEKGEILDGEFREVDGDER